MKHEVPTALDGARAERVAAELFELPRGAVRRLCEAGRVRVEGRRVKKGDPVRAGATIEIVGGSGWLVPDAAAPLVVLLERPDVVVLDKPRGVACHPLVPGEGGTLVDRAVARFPEIAHASPEPREAGLVHRLDTDTSGCTAVARTPAAYAALRRAFDEGRVEKAYLALVEGRVVERFVVDDPIDHDPRDPRRMITGAGRDARTVVEPLACGDTASLVRVLADRGRRHQVRVHLAARGHALCGDALYGATLAAPGLDGHALHASELALPELPRVHAPLPADFAAAAVALGCPLPQTSVAARSRDP